MEGDSERVNQYLEDLKKKIRIKGEMGKEAYNLEEKKYF